MPHVIIEFTDNLNGHIDKQELAEKAYEAVVKTGIFPIGGIRVRIHEIQHYIVADKHKDNGFIHLQMRVGHGRDEETRHKAAKTVFVHLSEWLEPVFNSRPFGLSIELNEIPKETNFKKNNMHNYHVQQQANSDNGAN